MANDKKKGLGKGLGALMGGLSPSAALSKAAPTAPAAPETPAAPITLADGSRLIEIDPTTLKPNPKQPRLVFDEEALAELADSIRRDGVQEPVIVREAPGGEGYELVSGERRVRASIMADRPLIPAVVREISDTDLLRLGLIENIQRENLNPIETAIAYEQLMQEFHWTQERLAEELGKKRASIANLLRLLQLPERVQEHIAAGALSTGHAKLLAGLDGEEAQERIATKVIADNLSVRATEELIARLKHPKTAPHAKTPAATPRDPNITQLEDELRRKFGRKSVLRVSPEGKGSIELQFFSWDDLEVLLQQLKSIK